MNASSYRRASILHLFLCETIRHADFQGGLGLPFLFAGGGAEGWWHFLEAGDEDVFFEGLALSVSTDLQIAGKGVCIPHRQFLG